MNVLSLLCVLALLGLSCNAQEATERRNLGFKGAVRSVLTTVARPNPDPRPTGQHKLSVEEQPDWVAFDTQGRRIEFASAASLDRVEIISKCAFQADGTEVCEDSTGHRQETRKQETTLPDGSRELAYFVGSKMQNREVTSFDEKGRAVASHNYDENGRLTSEESTLFGSDGDSTTWKIYDQSG